MEFKYRSDIDGLRAIAVLSVLFFHARVPGFSGGFVGVDIFFVISGYLITSIILKEINGNSFSVARFYERRIRRILPALFSVIVFVLIVGAGLLDRASFKELGQSMVATTLFSSNIYFWRNTNYFAVSSIGKPLLHTWSLAVEEQFYILFPLVLMIISRHLNGKYLRWVILIFFLSFGASVYGVIHRPSATFYLVPTRAWELMSGSIIALGALPSISSGWKRSLTALFGLALIGYCFPFYNETTPFPGMTALVPVLGTGMIIWSGMGGASHPVQKMLSAPPLVFIGLISYSLYLWHWPLVVFWKYLMFRPWGLMDSAVVIVASMTMATLTWKFVEQPFRGVRPLVPERKKLFELSTTLMATAIAIGFVIQVRDGMGGRIRYFYPETATVIDDAKNDTLWKLHVDWEKKTEKIVRGAVPPVVGAQGVKPSFALVGDSHAIAMISALESRAKMAGKSGFIITKSVAPPLLGVSITLEPYDNGFDEASHNNAVIEFIERHKEIQTVILTARWGMYIHGPWTEKGESIGRVNMVDNYGEYSGNQSQGTLLEVGLRRTLEKLHLMNRKVVLVSDVPEVGYDVPAAYFASALLPRLISLDDVRPTRQEYNGREHEANAILERMAQLPGVTLIRPEKWMFDQQGRGTLMAGGKLLYVDDNHLSTAGALYLSPVFGELFMETAKDQIAYCLH